MIKDVHDLRDLGFKIKVFHYRRFPQYGSDTICMSHVRKNERCTVDPRGGKTVVMAYKEGSDAILGMAECHYLDNYNKRYGREKAVERLVSNMSSSILVKEEV